MILAIDEIVYCFVQTVGNPGAYRGYCLLVCDGAAISHCEFKRAVYLPLEDMLILARDTVEGVIPFCVESHEHSEEVEDDIPERLFLHIRSPGLQAFSLERNADPVHPGNNGSFRPPHL